MYGYGRNSSEDWSTRGTQSRDQQNEMYEYRRNRTEDGYESSRQSRYQNTAARSQRNEMYEYDRNTSEDRYARSAQSRIQNTSAGFQQNEYEDKYRGTTPEAGYAPSTQWRQSRVPNTAVSSQQEMYDYDRNISEDGYGRSAQSRFQNTSASSQQNEMYDYDRNTSEDGYGRRAQSRLQNTSSSQQNEIYDYDRNTSEDGHGRSGQSRLQNTSSSQQNEMYDYGGNTSEDGYARSAQSRFQNTAASFQQKEMYEYEYRGNTFETEDASSRPSRFQDTAARSQQKEMYGYGGNTSEDGYTTRTQSRFQNTSARSQQKECYLFVGRLKDHKPEDLAAYFCKYGAVENVLWHDTGDRFAFVRFQSPMPVRAAYQDGILTAQGALKREFKGESIHCIKGTYVTLGLYLIEETNHQPDTDAFDMKNISQCHLFIHNMKDLTSNDVAAHFGKFGVAVGNIHVTKIESHQGELVFCSIEFPSPKQADAAYRDGLLSGQKRPSMHCIGNTCFVLERSNLSKKVIKERIPNKKPTSAHALHSTLYVGHIKQLTQQELASYFSKYGVEAANVSAGMNRKSGYDYAFIEFPSPSQARDAYQDGLLTVQDGNSMHWIGDTCVTVQRKSENKKPKRNKFAGKMARQKKKKQAWKEKKALRHQQRQMANQLKKGKKGKKQKPCLEANLAAKEEELKKIMQVCQTLAEQQQFAAEAETGFEEEDEEDEYEDGPDDFEDEAVDRLVEEEMGGYGRNISEAGCAPSTQSRVPYTAASSQQEVQPQAPDQQTLFVGNLKHLKKQDLAFYFGKFGAIENISILTNKNGMQVPPYAFIRYFSPFQVEAAYQAGLLNAQVAGRVGKAMHIIKGVSVTVGH